MSRRRKKAQRANRPEPFSRYRENGSASRPHTLRRYFKSEIFWILLVCLVAVGVTVFSRGIPFSKLVENTEPESILFVGDVMLARNVETLMSTKGMYYPWKGIRDLLQSHTVVIGNFEASIPKIHFRTPNQGFTFSVAPEAIEALPHVGFTSMTLANNHTYDNGKEGYGHTREVLEHAGLSVGGNPKTITSDEVIYHTIDGVKVAVIPINTIFETPALSEITKVLDEVIKKSDVQIVSIHWGTEYEKVANENERFFARALVDAGADAIIGHHPHVVQNIEEYRGAPIFYSLGNAVFDQYWNTDVQEGLAVALSFAENEIHYALIPITSADTRSAPRPMNRVERLQFLDTLAAQSAETLKEGIMEGIIVELFVPPAKITEI